MTQTFFFFKVNSQNHTEKATVCANKTRFPLVKVNSTEQQQIATITAINVRESIIIKTWSNTINMINMLGFYCVKTLTDQD